MLYKEWQKEVIEIKGTAKPLIEIEVCEIKGFCPVYKVGDRIVIDGAEIVLEKTDAVCVHALSTLLHYVVALDEGADPVKLGLTTSKEKRVAYMQCVDPGKPYTEGGTVIFRCRKLEKKEVANEARTIGRTPSRTGSLPAELLRCRLG